MSELFCVVCESFIETDGLMLVRNSGSRKTFLDRKSNVVHVTLNEKKSVLKRPPPEPEPETTIQKPEPPTPAPTVAQLYVVAAAVNGATLSVCSPQGTTLDVVVANFFIQTRKEGIHPF